MTMTVLATSPSSDSSSSSSDSLSSSKSAKHFYVTCLYDYTPKESPDAAFKASDKVRVVKVASSGWVCAETPSKPGEFAWLPISYTRRIHHHQQKKKKTEVVEFRPCPSTSPSKPMSMLIRSRSSSTTSTIESIATDHSGAWSDDEGDDLFDESSLSSSGASSLESIVETPAPKSTGLEDFLDWLLDLPINSTEYDKKLHMLLTSFTAFTTANNLLDLLIVKYQLTMLIGTMNKGTRREKLRTQKRVLGILALWMDKYRLVDDAPDLYLKLQDFLLGLSCSLPSSGQSQSSRNLVTQMHARLSSRMYGQYLHEGKRALASAIEHHRQPYSAPHGQSLPSGKLDALGPIDKVILAQQLTLYEWRLYSQITPKACLSWCRNQGKKKVTTTNGSGDENESITKFCGVSDKVSDWVKFTVLNEHEAVMRGDVIDHWIEIAELCASWNNISSTLSIVAALSSSVLERLKTSWSHSKRQAKLTELQKLVSPNNNFKACREFLKNVKEGDACVPFIGMNLTDLNHINDHFGNTTTLAPPPPPALMTPPPSPPPPSENTTTSFPSTLSPTSPPNLKRISTSSAPVINFTKCQKSVDIIDIMLHHQSFPYPSSIFEEDSTVMALVEECLTNAHGRSQEWFWRRSEKITKGISSGTRHERSNSEPVIFGVGKVGGWV